MRNIDTLYKLFLEELAKRKLQQEPQELYAPINYIMELGGKRLRPILLLMTYELFKDDIEQAMPLAYAIETFHNFSLVHDDIMDEATLRRGKPTVHHKFDTNTGILSGDVMLIYVYQYLLELESNKNITQIIKTFNQVAIEVCEGQQMDMNFETRIDVQLSEYIEMIGKKTAVLLAGAIKMGALAADASNEDAQHAYEFGKNVGIAFQLQDDLLDSFGDPKKFGKKVGGDIIQNKKTYLVLKALELASPEEGKSLLQILSNTKIPESEKVDTVKSIFTKLEIPTHTKLAKEKYQKLALQHLDAINVPESRKILVKKLAEEMLGRET